MKFDFGTVCERDIDVLLANLFGMDKEFLNLFIDKTDLPKASYDIKEIYLSKADKDGESDITLVIEGDGKKYGILIEDKIDAIAMPEQPERYIIRGKKGVENKEYEAFFSFIVCPKKYRLNNETAQKYPHVVYYEDIKEYLEKKTGTIYEIYCQELKQAIEKAKKPAKVTVDKNANLFFRKYKDYQEAKYPELNLTTKRDANGYWAHYTTRFGTVYLCHKIGDGKVDLTFNKAAKHLDKLTSVSDWLRSHDIVKCGAVVTGMAGALRVTVPKLNMQIPFEENDEYDIEVCFKTISELIEAVNIFGVACSVSDLK